MNAAPEALGRGLVLRSGTTPPAPWADAPVVTIDAASIADAAACDALADRLHHHWSSRTPIVIEWGVSDDAFSGIESTTSPPWSLDAHFLFPHERLRFLCFSNNYDARNGDQKWWWTVKAGSRLGAQPGGSADAILEDGTDVWIDGGPRCPLPDFGIPVVHGEAIESGKPAFVPLPPDVADVELAPDQAEAAGHGSGAARIIAPAGSGKTRTLAARFRHLLDGHRIEPAYLLGVAYNARAAEELRDRLGVDRSLVRTIHSLGWAIFRDAHPDLELIDEPEVRNHLNALVSVPQRANTDPIGPYLEALQTVRAGLDSPAAVDEARDDVAGFALAFEPFRERMYRRRQVDHGEQVYGAIEALLRDPQLRRRWQMKCRHLLVDEFQDLTPAYLLLIRLVASPELAVFGVGDDDQVIYGYDGADPGFLINYDEYFPGAGSHELHVNYRCPPRVVEAASHLLSHNRRRIAKTIRPGRTEDAADALVVAKREGRSLALSAAEVVGEWIESGVPPSDVAVLARVNSSLIAVKAALAEAGIPTNDLLSRRSLDRTMVRALRAWMVTAADTTSISRDRALEMIRRPARRLTRHARELLPRRGSVDDLRALAGGLDTQAESRWHEFCDDIEAAGAIAARADAGELIRHIVYDIGLGTAARQLDSGRSHAARPAHLDDLVAVERAAAVHPDLEDFFGWLAQRLDGPSHADGVTLSSVHRVKGMEWNNVLVFGADRGTMPHDLSDDIEEERRVFHVAITRGIHRVCVLADASRPSIFLSELDRDAERKTVPDQVAAPKPERLTEPTVAVGDHVRVRGGYEGDVTEVGTTEIMVQLDTGAELSVGRHDILPPEPPPAEATEADADLVEALRTWRLETSRRLGVPAYVVFNNVTLEAIASRRPSTERELLAITGIGPRKLEDYGDDIIELVLDHA